MTQPLRFFRKAAALRTPMARVLPTCPPAWCQACWGTGAAWPHRIDGSVDWDGEPSGVCPDCEGEGDAPLFTHADRLEAQALMGRLGMR